VRQAKDAMLSADAARRAPKWGGRSVVSVGARPTNEHPNRRGVLTLTSRVALLLRWLPIGSGLMGLWLAASTTAHALTTEERAIAWETFQATGRNEWQRASRLAALIDDPLPAKTVRWLRMVEDGQPADFATVARFLIDNPQWPWPKQLQAIAEDTITDPADHALIRRLFAARPPLTTRGHIRYAEALFDINQDEPAEALIRKAWVEGDFSPREEQRFLQKYRRLLSRADHIARLDNLLWDFRRNSAKRTLALVPDGYRRLAEARMRVQRRQNGLDKAIEAVPAELRNDPGLTFDRMRWRRQKRLDDGVLEVLLDPPEELGRPGLWWFERELQIRRAFKRNFELAYQLASRHRQTAGDEFAEAEWLAGWLALRFIDQPNTALRHFNRLYDGVRAPVARASAAFGGGRSATALGDRWLAGQWYRRAAEVPIAYYGQLAAEALGEAGQPLPDPPPADPMQRAAFESQELVRVVRMLIDADATRELPPFLLRLGEQATSATEVGLVAELAATSGRPHLVAQVGRQTAYYGVPNHVAAFPIPEVAGLMRPAPGEPEAALLMGVGRQESMFNPWVSSHAGARGLLQLIPRTAFLMARQVGLPYNPGRLIGDPDYNVRLGSHYLKTLLKHYDGEVALAVAAYNAGPSRVDEWIRLHGDPRRGDAFTLVDWIELIPFDETRNYVQRVLEGRNMYRRRLASDDPATVWFRPVNGPLEPLPWPLLKPLDEVQRITIAELLVQAPRPLLKPDTSAPPVTILPAGYHSQNQTAPVPLSKPSVPLRVAAELPLPAPRPRPAS
jgi:soluble lytic murein transglycosylase